MRVANLIQRPIFVQIANFSKLIKPRLSTEKSDPLTQVITILEKSNPIEQSLDPVAHILDPRIVSSIMMKPPNFQMGFRFYIWAMKRRSLRAWELNDLVIDMILKENSGFDLCWETLEEVRKCGVDIPSEVFFVLISSYWKAGDAEKAVESFGKMKEFGCIPDVYTYNAVLYIMVQKQVLMLALAVYNQMLKFNCSPNVATYSILIDFLCKSGKIQDALNLFVEMAQNGISPNTITYTIVISGLCLANRTNDAQILLNKMTSSGCPPDSITCNAMLSGVCKMGKIDEAFWLLQSFQDQGYTLGINSYSCLIDSLFRAGRFEEANLWFGKLCEANIHPDLVLYTIMIRGFSEAGKIKDAWKIVQEMTERGVVPDTQCYNTLIKGFCDLGLLEDAQSLKLEISENNCFPDTCTYTILICGACRNGMVGEAKKIFEEMEKVGCLPSVVTFNALIDGLCKAGEYEEARLLFYKMEIGRNPSLFLRLSQGTDRALDKEGLDNLVARLCDSGSYLKAYRLLMKLADNGVLPDTTTYNTLINGLCKSRNVNGAFKLLKELQLKGLSPDCVTYGTLIDGFYSVDREEEAIGLLRNMMKNGCSPNSTVYKTVMTWSSRKKKVSMTFGLWLDYLRSLKNRDDEAIKLIEEHFEKGELSEAVRGLLKMDFKLNNFDVGPYTIWMNGLCEAQRVDEALKIFNVLLEFNITITPPSCVKLIQNLCSQQKLDLAVNVFLHTLDKKTVLRPPICNQLFCALLRSKAYVKHAFDLLGKMESMGYNLDNHLDHKTKSLWQYHLYMQESATSS
ncbi:pentatricopeptide repeat-containing protein At1g79540 [Spinacia oleracea]|uniref:Pentatricopeptide repeat-containing protein At1g79540 n=1 Tax=Spinacia oleracea TaxID=3562 RepID=A0A9R0K8T6_SPIOL|nr:pentatricopeptide repeat-containing protein At1g79540 [Spinacia oleracea]XP_021861619.2 pentatricopeptide repeat-containing protein At1g79540 [Spinacia oleracea]XP_021861624.2 pentatricopeptide repeat-containing protein At1g79540 [Spinacia oleracea]XP_021861635.2 pentatricopeptide repeat-containing protein At1g79540 [Spinacia oleracea]XP_021861640.2 pentatricopeptide repeat-containing protein At1g79540 [Spinacia oleracea]XP_021861645.2 pentatricopeptide repeat-containing protein At1g79540 [